MNTLKKHTPEEAREHIGRNFLIKKQYEDTSANNLGNNENKLSCNPREFFNGLIGQNIDFYCRRKEWKMNGTRRA